MGIGTEGGLSETQMNLIKHFKGSSAKKCLSPKSHILYPNGMWCGLFFSQRGLKPQNLTILFPTPWYPSKLHHRVGFQMYLHIVSLHLAIWIREWWILTQNITKPTNLNYQMVRGTKSIFCQFNAHVSPPVVTNVIPKHFEWWLVFKSRMHNLW